MTAKLDTAQEQGEQERGNKNAELPGEEQRTRKIRGRVSRWVENAPRMTNGSEKKNQENKREREGFRWGNKNQFPQGNPESDAKGR